MSFSQILEVTLGLIVVYYILGAIVSLVTQIALESRETRAAALEMQLKRLVGSLTADLTGLPQIKALQPIRYANWWTAFTGDTEQKKVEKIPLDTLVDAFFDLSGLTSRGSLGADELVDLIGKLPPSEGKQAVLDWIHQGVTSLTELRSRSSAYVAGLLNQAALIFRAKARSFVIISSIVITLLFGVDSLQLATDLWKDAGLRSVAVQQAQLSASQPESATGLSALANQLNALSFHIGWWRDQGIPSAASTLDWLKYVFLKLVGLGITAAAVSQGSSFWYDMLKRLTGPASALAPETRSAQKEGALG
jgi:hypothetical protein